jgi:hypothetical protein
MVFNAEYVKGRRGRLTSGGRHGSYKSGVFTTEDTENTEKTWKMVEGVGPVKNGVFHHGNTTPWA